MNRASEVADVVTFYRSAFSVIFALALAEGFKQTVHDKANELTAPVLYRDKVPSLLAFLFLIIPFYQGTIRFYGHSYGDANTLANYSYYIMFDSICFLIEAAIFFYVSSALSPVHWISFYSAVGVLLWFDSFWGIVTSQMHSNPVPVNWLILNLIWGALAGVLIWQRKRFSNETRCG